MESKQYICTIYKTVRPLRIIKAYIYWSMATGSCIGTYINKSTFKSVGFDLRFLCKPMSRIALLWYETVEPMTRIL